MVSNCRSSEGNTSPGDQSGNEYRLQSWWSFPWDVVLRHPDRNVQRCISNYARHAALNDNIGYSQGDRYSFGDCVTAVKNYDPVNITTKCNADCSSSTAIIVRAVGYRLGIAKMKNVMPSNTTWTLEDALVLAGFSALGYPYTTDESQLTPGDILLNTNNHVCIYVSDKDLDINGSDIMPSDTPSTPIGVVKPELKTMLTRMPLLKTNSYEYNEVKNLQSILNRLGYELEVDGKYGTKTAEAVKDIQNKSNLFADGECGADTWAKLIGM